MMTREELIKAFTLRLDGETWDAIGERMNCTGQSVRYAVNKSIDAKYGNPIRRKATVVYPAVRKIMDEQFGGRMYPFCQVLGMSASWGYEVFSGTYPMPSSTANKVADAFGVSVDEVTRRDDR